MSVLEIKTEAALTAHQNGTKNQKALLENLFGKKVFFKSLIERIKNFDDILEEAGILKSDFELSCTGLEHDEICYRQLKLISKVLNEGWVPNWKNSSEYKYYAWFYMDNPSGSGFSSHDCVSWHTTSTVGSRLCFKSSELAKFAGTTFTEIYEGFMVIKS